MVPNNFADNFGTMIGAEHFNCCLINPDMRLKSGLQCSLSSICLILREVVHGTCHIILRQRFIYVQANKMQRKSDREKINDYRRDKYRQCLV